MMKKMNTSGTAWSLIAANMIPLAGVVFLGWNAAALVLLYWAENLVVGFYNLLKMIILKVYGRTSFLEMIFFLSFFCFHYGLFCVVHGYVLWMVFYGGGHAASLLSVAESGGSSMGVHGIVALLARLRQLLEPEMTWMIFCLFASHGVSFAQNYLGKKEYRYWTAPKLMLLPYQRLLVLHVVVITGAVLIGKAGSPACLLAVLVFAKTALDLLLHQREHRIM